MSIIEGKDKEPIDDDKRRQVEQFYRRATLECTPDIAAATVPFFVVQNNELKQDRTGVLLQIADSYFMLTASHHLLFAHNEGIWCYIAPVNQGGNPIPLDDVQVVGTEQDVLDVAVLKLTQTIVDSLVPVRRFLRLNDLDLDATSHKGFYLLMGYPLDYSTVDDEACNIVSNPVRIGCFPYKGKTNPQDVYVPTKHILLEYQRELVHGFDGSPTQGPQVKGLSGCGIWRLARLRKGVLNHWSAEERRLVAIQHSWDKERNYVKGSWVGYAVGQIWKHFPNLRRAIEFNFPGGFTL